MENKTRLWQMISGCFIIISICSIGILLYVTHQTKLSVQDRDLKITALTKQNKALDSKYSELYEQKNGNANKQLVLATNGLFSSLLEYNTKQDTIKSRREKALKFASDKALETVLPKEATTYNASVQSVSKIKGKPQIYFEPSNAKKQKVLVIIDNEIVIDNNYPTEAKWQYEATFDTDKNAFIELKMLGELQQLDKKDN